MEGKIIGKFEMQLQCKMKDSSSCSKLMMWEMEREEVKMREKVIDLEDRG